VSTPPQLIHFDEWTLDPGSGELMRRGTRTVLQEQPLQVLLALLQRPGQIVTREELIARLWPNRIVDFDAGLNAVIRRLRATLHEDGETPRYIETLPRRGYRFIGQIEAQEAADADMSTKRIGATEPGFARGDCLVVVHAPHHGDVGRRHALRRETTTIGRGHENDIVLPGQSVSRRHARIERRAGTFSVIDETSTNGTFLNYASEPLREEPLGASDELRIGDWILRCLSGADVESQYHQLMHQLTLVDGLTGVNNRRHFDTLLAAEAMRAHRHQRPLSLLMIDIDRLAGINDKYGQLAGETLLRALAAILRARARPQDAVGRQAGGEFCVLMPETPLPAAAIAAESLRSVVKATTFCAGRREIPVTISAVAAALQPGMQPDELLRAAREKLVEVKRAAR
jgi:two-component system cell cycle response regulator